MRFFAKNAWVVGNTLDVPPHARMQIEAEEMSMSLTREQWKKMWDSVKRLEKVAERLDHKSQSELARRIRVEIEFMKKDIQSVIGQME